MKRLFLFSALLCFLGLYSIEIAHHHVKDADEMACAVCHVAAHSATHAPVLPLRAPAFSPVLLFLVALAGVSCLFDRGALRPRSRSPPAFS